MDNVGYYVKMGGEDGEETTLSQISMQVYNVRQHWHSFL